jgi:hypothetical protein
MIKDASKIIDVQVVSYVRLQFAGKRVPPKIDEFATPILSTGLALQGDIFCSFLSYIFRIRAYAPFSRRKLSTTKATMKAPPMSNVTKWKMKARPMSNVTKWKMKARPMSNVTKWKAVMANFHNVVFHCNTIYDSKCTNILFANEQSPLFD